MSMSLGQARIVDPVLTNIVRGFRQPGLVGEVLFPRVPVSLSGGQVLEFGREAFRLYDARRAPGSATKRIDMGHVGRPYALENHSLEGKVPREILRDASRSPGIDFGARAVNVVMSALLLGLENQQAQVARALASYPVANRVTLAPGARWSTATVDPNVAIESGREAIRAAVGMYPNVAVLSARAFAACRRNPFILDRFRYTSAASIGAEMLASLWNLERVAIGQSVFASGANDDFGDVWGTDAILAFAPQASVGAEQPSYGYTYMMEGHPLVEQGYYDGNARSWIYATTIERVPVIAGVGAGYLIQTAAD
jgi:hypothetical protein